MMKNESGEYRCITKDDEGDSVRTVFRLRVLYAPGIQIPIQHVRVYRGVVVELTCVVDGEPQPQVRWTKGGKKIVSDENYKQKKVDEHVHVLLIHSIRESDFGRYECSASNSLGSSSAAAEIEDRSQVSQDKAVSICGSFLDFLAASLFLCALKLLLPQPF